MAEKTLVMIKPNGVRKNLIGEVISRFEKSGLSVSALEMKILSKEQAELFYAEHKGKPFYEPLMGFMTSGPIVAMVVEGEGAVAAVRAIAGATDPKTALPGTLRHNYGDSVRENLIHASDSIDSADREIKFHFGKKE